MPKSPLSRRLGASIFFATTLAGCIGTDLIDANVEPTLSIMPKERGATSGTTIQFTAEVTDRSGAPQQNPELEWESADLAVATIDAQSGLATAQGVGQTIITVRAPDIDPNLTGTALLNVVDTATSVAVVVVSPSEVSVLAPQDQIQLSAEAQTVDGSPVNAMIRWSSGDESVATVDASGLVTAVEPGSTVIAAEADGIKSREISLRVAEPGAARSGMFAGRSSYTVRGTATLSQEGARTTLGFSDDFSTSNGPDLQVFLSPEPSAVPGSISLGSIQRTSGAQTYDVPAGSDIESLDWVLIHCVPFNVTFGLAPLE